MMNVILLGGGLDSTTLLAYLRADKKDLVALNVDYGQKAVEGERKACDYFCEKYGIPMHFGSMHLGHFSNSSIMRGHIGTREENRLELRNVALLSYASVLCASKGGGRIYLGLHKEEDNLYPDAHIDWLNPMRVALSLALPESTGVDIITPFFSKSRLDIVMEAQEQDPEILTRSYTCYESPSISGSECGVCVHCIAKKEMLGAIK